MSCATDDQQAPRDYSDGSPIDLAIRSMIQGVVAYDAARVAGERDVAAFALWVGVEETRDMFRQALALHDEASRGR